MINNFNYYTPTKIVFGDNTVCKIGSLASSFGAKKVLIHYGSPRVIKSGLIDSVKNSLEGFNINYVLLGGVVPNPRLELVYQGIDMAKKENVDMIIAVGGGSVIDSAKAIAYGAKYDGDVWDFYLKKSSPKEALPLGVVLTMAATGSEMSNSSVISNDETKEKLGCNSDISRPAFSILDPSLTLTLPLYQTAAGCVDILMHTFERYFTSKGNMLLTDEIAEGLMRTVIDCSIKLKENPKDLDARGEILWAGSLSHNGLTGCGNAGNDFATHKLEHELSAKFDVTHGAGLAALWGSWARYVIDICPERFYRFATKVMNISSYNGDINKEDISKEEMKKLGLLGIEATEDFFKSIDMPTSLKELVPSIKIGDLEDMADRCSNISGGHIGSCKILDREDMLSIYKMAFDR